MNTTDFANSKSGFGGVTAGHVNYVQELTIEVHNQTGNVFTTWDKYKVVTGNLQSNIVNEERYGGKKSLLEVTDMPIAHTCSNSC